MTFHDQFCGHADGGACICTQLLAARADERERHGNNCRGMWDEWLHDLRAQVEGMRDESIWARRGTVAENGLDTVPSAWHNGRTSLADVVLALIEEAGQ